MRILPASDNRRLTDVLSPTRKLVVVRSRSSRTLRWLDVGARLPSRKARADRKVEDYSLQRDLLRPTGRLRARAAEPYRGRVHLNLLQISGFRGCGRRQNGQERTGVDTRVFARCSHAERSWSSPCCYQSGGRNGRPRWPEFRTFVLSAVPRCAGEAGTCFASGTARQKASIPLRWSAAARKGHAPASPPTRRRSRSAQPGLCCDNLMLRRRTPAAEPITEKQVFQALLRTLDLAQPFFASHSQRVAQLGKAIASELGLSESDRSSSGSRACSMTSG